MVIAYISRELYEILGSIPISESFLDLFQKNIFIYEESPVWVIEESCPECR